MAKKDDECVELKNIKYQTMLINKTKLNENTQTHTTNIEQFLKRESAQNIKKPWNKLEKSTKRKKLSKFVGKSRSYIANSLRLLGLPDEVLSMVETGDLSAGHARSLIGLNNAAEIAKKIISKKLSVRQSEVLARQFKEKKIKLVHKKDANILDLQKDLEEKTGLSVSINNKKNNSGSISFEYRDLDQLDRLINTIKKNY